MKIKNILLSAIKQTNKQISISVNPGLNKLDATERYRPQQK